MTRLVFCCLVLLLGGCSGTSGPIIDTRDVDMTQYRQDLQECEAYAEQVSTTRAVGKGAAGGAVVGAAIGAIGGGSGTRGAGVGAVAGGAQSARTADHEKTRVVHNCLRGRGYKVLN